MYKVTFCNLITFYTDIDIYMCVCVCVIWTIRMILKRYKFFMLQTIYVFAKIFSNCQKNRKKLIGKITFRRFCTLFMGLKTLTTVHRGKQRP